MGVRDQRGVHVKKGDPPEAALKNLYRRGQARTPAAETIPGVLSLGKWREVTEACNAAKLWSERWRADPWNGEGHLRWRLIFQSLMELYQEYARQVRAQYTREFNHAAVRHVRSGHAIVVVAKVLGIPKASLGNYWVRVSAKGELVGAGCRDKSIQVSPEQIKIARLRENNARVRMERDIAKKPRRTSRRTHCGVRLDSPDEKAVPGDRRQFPGPARWQPTAGGVLTSSSKATESCLLTG